MHPPGCPPEKQQARRLPFYRNVVAALEQVCEEVRERSDGTSCSVEEAEVDNSWIDWDKNPGFETQRPKRDISIGMWMGGPNPNALLDLRSLILERAPIQLVGFFLRRGGGGETRAGANSRSQKTATVDLEHDHYYSDDAEVREKIQQHLTNIAKFTGVDIFLLKPEDSKSAGDPEVDASQSKRLRIKIYGDYEGVEHAKTRVLLMIDDMV